MALQASQHVYHVQKATDAVLWGLHLLLHVDLDFINLLLGLPYV
jgi:hypothetical protein